MGRLALKKLIILFFLIVCPNSCYATDVNSKLSKIIEQIKSVRQLILTHQSKRNTLQKDLEKTELAINQISQNLHKTTEGLEKEKQAIHQLIFKQQLIDSKIKKQQSLLLQQIRAAYLIGLNKNNVQLLLRGNDMQQVNRLLTYNRYLAMQNSQVITALKEDQLSLEENKKALLTNMNHLAELKQHQSLEQKTLDANKKNQHAVLENISQQMKTHTQQLNELLQNKKNLENVVASLQKKSSYDSEYLTHHKGRFPWPTAGSIIERFGSNIQGSELKQNGVLISAPEGQKVYAVAPGKVIFANWMPGYGLLLIIDHGKGYMTLYGNNGVLYKKAHEVVGAQELVATVGHTGGQPKSALYFALRLKGKAVNPNTWCGDTKA